MICPNCGREISDTARECPGCGAVTHAIRRRKAQASDTNEEARVERKVMPDKSATKHKSEKDVHTAQYEMNRRAVPSRERQGSSDVDVPVGLRRQKEKKHTSVRRVRHAPDHLRRKTDARPAMIQPPIHPKSYKRLIITLFVISLILVSSFSEILRSSENETFFSAVFMQVLSLFSFAVFSKRL